MPPNAVEKHRQSRQKTNARASLRHDKVSQCAVSCVRAGREVNLSDTVKDGPVADASTRLLYSMLSATETTTMSSEARPEPLSLRARFEDTRSRIRASAERVGRSPR